MANDKLKSFVQVLVEFFFTEWRVLNEKSWSKEIELGVDHNFLAFLINFEDYDWLKMAYERIKLGQAAFFIDFFVLKSLR